MGVPSQNSIRGRASEFTLKSILLFRVNEQGISSHGKISLIFAENVRSLDSPQTRFFFESNLGITIAL
jgi:hypothetical protein